MWGDGTKYPITEAQIKVQNVALIRQLVGEYPITHLIGHHEHNAMEGHPCSRAGSKYPDHE